jgi:hypothetical protein
LQLATAHGAYAAVLKSSAVPLLGARAHDPSYSGGAIALGLLCHYLVAAGWGMMFAVFAYGMSRAGTLGFGLVWGFVVWMVMYGLVLPIVGMGEVARSAPVGPAILSHLIFGLFLGLAFLPFQQRQAWFTPRRPLLH